MAEKLFSERSGIIPEKSLQIDDIDRDLKNRIWNIIFASYFERTTQNKSYASILNSIWKDFLKQPINEMPGTSYSDRYRGIFLELKWYGIYDLLEFIVQCENQINNPEDPENKTNVFIADFCSECNRAFEEERSAFRFVGTKIVKIVDKTEISEVEESLERCAAIPGAKHHIEKAVSLFSKRENPDYPNSIKESMSAVETMCRLITGDEKASLGKALNILKKNSPIAIHGSLLEAWKKLYGYASDAEGIRHAAVDFSNADCADAKFMLISCSAFVNHLIVKANNAGIKLN